MLELCGSTVCVLDATYSTTCYGLPLFVLCVPTNCGYVIAARFLAADEQASTIQVALRTLSQWCPNWKPKSFLLDFSGAQIAAMEAVFPGLHYSVINAYHIAVNKCDMF